MSLGDKLRRLGALGGHAGPQSKPAMPPTAARMPSVDNPASVAHLPGFQAVVTRHGTVFRKDRVFPLTYQRGSFALDMACHVTTAGWQVLLSRGAQLSDVSVTDAVFVDTETTGLGRGTGTYAFLVGIGRYTDAGFVVRQYIMPDYNHESPMIHAVVQELNAASLVFTFNGKSFDGPLLQTRAIMNGMRLRLPPHIDLYHLSRRFFASRSENCSLNQLEIDILRTKRTDDVPGYMIPSLYFDFLRNGNAMVWEPICRHNELDILSSAALAAYIGQAVDAPFTATLNEHPLNGADLYAVGQLYWQRGDEAMALRCFEEARVRPHPPGLAHAICQGLTTLYKRHGRYESALALWHDMVADGVQVTAALVELAKYYEHHARDYARALAYTQRCLDYVGQYEPLTGTRITQRQRHDVGLHDALHHRRRRLENRLHGGSGRVTDADDPDIP